MFLRSHLAVIYDLLGSMRSVESIIFLFQNRQKYEFVGFAWLILASSISAFWRHPYLRYSLALRCNLLRQFILQRISDEGSVPEMFVWSILHYSILKLCINFSKSPSLKLNNIQARGPYLQMRTKLCTCIAQL